MIFLKTNADGATYVKNYASNISLSFTTLDGLTVDDISPYISWHSRGCRSGMNVYEIHYELFEGDQLIFADEKYLDYWGDSNLNTKFQDRSFSGNTTANSIYNEVSVSAVSDPPDTTTNGFSYFGGSFMALQPGWLNIRYGAFNYMKKIFDSNYGFAFSGVEAGSKINNSSNSSSTYAFADGVSPQEIGEDDGGPPSGTNSSCSLYFNTGDEGDFEISLEAFFVVNACGLDVKKFDTALLAVGMKYYTDRNYVLTDVPEAYRGMETIITPNDDQNLTAFADYMKFATPPDGTVYVAYDSRAKSLPKWLDEFEYTGDAIKTSLSSQPFLKIYRRRYISTHCVQLGANKADGFEGNTISNFIVFYNADVQPRVCTLDPKFKETALAAGMKYYTDRDYTLTSVPSVYTGMDTIITPNDERNLTISSNYITLTMSDDSMVYVAYDSRAISEPDWMNGFIDTGDIIKTSLSSQPSLKIYSKNYTAGDCVNFGANRARGFVGNTVSYYIVFYGKGGGVPIDCALNNKFEKTTMKLGEYYYTDRNYTITGGIPDWMAGRTMIQTPNDERFDKSDNGYMSFTNPVDWWVYVLFDSRSSSIPDWLKGWELRGEKIKTSLSSQPSMKLYRKQFDAGACVNLGGNYGPGSSGETRSNYAVVYGK
ncbi:MAG: hypothetical protein WAM73_08755 [Desulfobacterales bacterium]